jgi:hypothetical protein
MADLDRSLVLRVCRQAKAGDDGKRRRPDEAGKRLRF